MVKKHRIVIFSRFFDHFFFVKLKLNTVEIAQIRRVFMIFLYFVFLVKLKLNTVKQHKTVVFSRLFFLNSYFSR